VLDGGARSEQVRKGQFRFDAVRSGDHTLTLLQDSLPEGSRIAGSAEIAISLTHAQPRADVSFVVSIEPRQEQRRIFAPSTTPSSRPPADSTSAPRHPLDPPRKPVPPIKGRAATPRATRTGPPPASAMPGAPRVESAGEFAIQVIALNDPARAREIASALRAEGLPAYVLEPPPSDPDGPYRVRVGRFATSGEAEAVATALGKARGERPWVIRER
jgi:DedD protein